MLRQLGRIAIITSLLLVLPLWLMRAQSDSRADLETLLAVPDDCQAPCIMGIRPGVTSIEEAIVLLEAHPWVDSVTIEYLRLQEDFGRGILSWTWSDAHPAAVDPQIPGRINFHVVYTMVVDAVTIHTRLPTEDIINWYGAPRGGIFRSESRILTYGVLYQPVADAAYIGVSTTIRCPANHLDYWNSQGEIFLIAAVGIDAPVVDVTDALGVC